MFEPHTDGESFGLYLDAVGHQRAVYVASRMSGGEYYRPHILPSVSCLDAYGFAAVY